MKLWNFEEFYIIIFKIYVLKGGVAKKKKIPKKSRKY